MTITSDTPTYRKAGEVPKGTDTFEYAYLDFARQELVSREELYKRYPDKAYVFRNNHPLIDQQLTAISHNRFSSEAAFAMCRRLTQQATEVVA